MRRIVAATAALLAGTLVAVSGDAAQITSVSPASGPTAGNVPITINGSNFSVAGNTVTVGGQPCPVTDELPGSIVCTLPPGTGASRPIEVQDSGGGAGSPPYPFKYTNPLITEISFPALSPAGSSVITIRGIDFGAQDADHYVRVGNGGGCSNVHVDQPYTSVTCTMPPGEGANVPVSIVVDGQASPPSPVSYDAPAITGITPTRGSLAGGEVITIRGDNFGPSSLALIGGAPCPVEDRTADAIECILPPGASGPAAVRVLSGGQASSDFAYTRGSVASKCDAAKLKAAAGLAKCVAGVEAKAATKGVDPYPDVLNLCGSKFDASCAKAEAKLGDCSQIGTCPELAAATKCCRHKGWDGTIKGSTR